MAVSTNPLIPLLDFFGALAGNEHVLFSSWQSRAARPWLLAILILFSFFGYLADTALNGTPLDPNIVSQDVLR